MRLLLIVLLASCRTGEIDSSNIDGQLADLTARLEALEASQADVETTQTQHTQTLSDHALFIEELGADVDGLAEEISAVNGSIDLSELDAQVDNNTTNLSVNEARLTAAEGDIDTLSNNQNTQAVELALLDATLTTHHTQIDSLEIANTATAADLSLVQTQSAANSATALQNANDISSNAANIAINTGATATNAVALASQVTDIATNTADIATNTNAIANNTTDIATNATTSGNNASALALLTTDIQTQSSDIADHASDINSLSDSIVALEDEISCPTDMVDAGGFCIDIEQNTSASWQGQTNVCQSEGKRLCSMAEWIGACSSQSTLGLNNMLSGNFEYVDEYWVMNYVNGNYYSAYVSVGATECGRIYYSGWGCANGNCYDTTNAGGSYPSRCCL